MGKITQGLLNVTFTPLQKFIFDEFAKNSRLKKLFYLTGDTALSAFYLHHRESEDLDFFSEENFDSEKVEKFIQRIARAKNLQIRFTSREVVKIYELLKEEKVEIKVDFAYYPYKRLKRGIKVNGISVDSIRDIATNKLQTITSRTEVKDFVDLFFLLEEFTLWDLIYGLKEKFNTEIDLFWLGSDFLKVEKFEFLPKMLVPLKLKTLQDFYRSEAKKLSKSVVER